VTEPEGATTKIDLRFETLKRSWLFSNLSADTIQELASLSTFRRFGKGDIIFHQGDAPAFLYVIGSGKVKQFKTCLSGKTFTAVINSTGDPLNVSALFGGKAHFVTTQAISDVGATVTPRRNFLAYVEKYPLVTTRILSAMSMIISSAYERLSDLAGETAAQRVLNVLFMLYFKFGTTISFTREEIADVAGTTPETTTRVLASLKGAGIIGSRRGGLDILDVEKLREICRGSYLIPLRDLEE
jgi:CRP-like cAMP-binding protein